MNDTTTPESGRDGSAGPFANLGQAPMMSPPQMTAEPPPQASDVGTLLCATRMRLGKDLQDVAAVLHIRYNFLVAIEDGRYEDLPGQAYAIGFVRAYADHLGLDGDEVVRRYKEETAGIKRVTRYEYPIPPPESGIPSGALLLIAVVLGMVVYGVWYSMADADRRAADVIQEVPDRLAAMLRDDTATTPDAEQTPEPQVADSGMTEEPAPPPEDDQAVAGAPETPPATQTPATAVVDPAAVAPAVVASATPPAVQAPVVAKPETAPLATKPEAAVAPAPAQQATPQQAAVPSPVVKTPAQQTLTAAEPAKPAPAPTVSTNTTPAPATPPAAATPAAPKPSTPAPTAAATTTAQAPIVTPAAKPAATPVAQAAKPEIAKPEAAKVEAPKVEAPKVEAPKPASTPASTSTQTPPVQTAAAPTPAPAAPKPEPARVEAPKPASAPAATATPPAQSAAVPPATAPKAAAPKAASSGKNGNVELRAKSDSWIQVRDGEQLLLTRFLRKGESYKVPDRSGLTLMTLNAGGVEVIVDGAVMPPLGEQGSVARGVSLDADKLKAQPKAAAAPAPSPATTNN